MNWELVQEDTYYRGRTLEADARRTSDPMRWEAYAELKARKGSYALGIHGVMNAASLYEARGEGDLAVCAYEQGLTTAMRAGYKELAVILTYRMAQIYESGKDWDACIAVYERLGAFCEKRELYFLAADAYEHAAEMMVRAGRKVTAYRKPIELWKQNARYWEDRGEEDDALWSRQHIALYEKLFGGTA
ncbi:MAG: hypothetical protein V1800_01215 [Candidatus Latescibacterota bacterium]